MAALLPLLAILILALTAWCEDTCCPDAWLAYKGSCYLFHDEEKMDWNEAQQYCHYKKHVASNDIVTLVAIETNMENLFLKYYASKLFKRGSHDRNTTLFWLGASDSDTEGIWKWVDKDEELTYTDWGTSQSNNYSDKYDCLVLNGLDDFHWRDVPCGVRIGYPICEKRGSSTGSGPIQIIG